MLRGISFRNIHKFLLLTGCMFGSDGGENSSKIISLEDLEGEIIDMQSKIYPFSEVLEVARVFNSIINKYSIEMARNHCTHWETLTVPYMHNIPLETMLYFIKSTGLKLVEGLEQSEAPIENPCQTKDWNEGVWREGEWDESDFKECWFRCEVTPEFKANYAQYEDDLNKHPSLLDGEKEGEWIGDRFICSKSGEIIYEL